MVREVDAKRNKNIKKGRIDASWNWVWDQCGSEYFGIGVNDDPSVSWKDTKRLQ
jgi:hypothetical protein